MTVYTCLTDFYSAPTYFPMASEMKDPRLFTRAVILSQAIVIAVYMVSATPVGGRLDLR